jgi:signal transduction histidine kinase
VVSNKIAPKVEQDGTGIGLSNLDSRHRLLTGKGITILNDGETFTVKLPLSK